MTARMRKAIGGAALVFGLVLYVLTAAALGAALLPGHWAVQIPYYVLAGIAWIFPAKYLLYWMQRADD